MQAYKNSCVSLVSDSRMTEMTKWCLVYPCVLSCRRIITCSPLLEENNQTRSDNSYHMTLVVHIEIHLDTRGPESFASESSSSSATKGTACLGHCPWKSARFSRVYWSTGEQLCDTALAHQLVDCELLWAEILLCHRGKKFFSQVITTACENQLMGDFSAQVRRCLLPAEEWTWIYTLSILKFQCLKSWPFTSLI